jgi:hypothetical protein
MNEVHKPTKLVFEEMKNYAINYCNKNDFDWFTVYMQLDHKK